ncbi:MAG TPA: hypothetical protein VFI70_08305 [Nitrososphaeraceae archaeon]|nr:hypothetical protein [Nitrososphaeraceae archaeon]
MEERKHPTAEKPAIEFVNDTFNPSDRFEARFANQDGKLNEINEKLTRLSNNNSMTIAESSKQISEGVADM